jgi:signal transduction histidine kinase
MKMLEDSPQKSQKAKRHKAERRAVSLPWLFLCFLYFCAFCGEFPALAQREFPGAEPLQVWQQSQRIQRDYIEVLKKRSEAEPDDISLRMDLGRAYYWLALSRGEGAVIEGERIFKEILARDPDNAVALAYYGSLLGLKIGDRLIPKEQIVSVAMRSSAALDRAVSLAPDSAEVRQARGHASLYTPSVAGRDHLAIEDFTRVIEIFQRLPGARERQAEVHLALGDAYRKMGKLAEARAQWEQARALHHAPSITLAAEARLQQLEGREAGVDIKRLAAMAGFLIGVIVYGALAALVLRDLVRLRRRSLDMAASLIVALIGLGWNGANLVAAVRAAINPDAPGLLGQWQEHFLAVLLAPIPIGLVVAYRFYMENLRLHEAQRKHALAEEELRRLLAQAELKALRAQIDPHFFFNSLNSVTALIHRNPPAAEALLADLADLFRHAFKPSREFVALEEELHLVETYLKVEQVRLGDKLQFRKSVAPEALAIRVPALTIQPLVENAVRHGVSGGGSITLTAALTEDCLEVIVADNGSGIAPSLLRQIFSRGVGLSNVNERLLGLYGEQSRLRVNSQSGRGTTVSFSIPLAKLQAASGAGSVSVGAAC